MGAFSDVVGLALIARQQVRDLSDRGLKFHNWVNPFPPDMAGACGIVSLHIMNMAFKRGLHPSFVRGDYDFSGHCWIEYYGHIIDATATQFIAGAKPVHIVSNFRARNNPIYRKNSFRKVSSEKDIEEIEQSLSNWMTYLPELKKLAL